MCALVYRTKEVLLRLRLVINTKKHNIVLPSSSRSTDDDDDDALNDEQARDTLDIKNEIFRRKKEKTLDIFICSIVIYITSTMGSCG